MIFLEAEYRAFCPTGDGGGVKNDCSSSEGGASPRVSSSWKRDQEKVVWTRDDLKSSPPSKSLAKANSVAMLDGELTGLALKEVGVTLDQAVRACTSVTPESNIVVAHGGLREIIEWGNSDEPERFIEDRVTVINTMSVSGMEGAAKIAASLAREEDGELVMTYSMLKISDEAQKAAPVAVARQMMKGTVASITEAEKIGVGHIEMLAAGSNKDTEFKGYRIWPRLGFDGIIPRKAITPTWSLSTGVFNRYGSSIPDKILSPRAKKEKADGALTIQALYETEEGQKWWEQNGGEMEMFLNIADKKSPSWKRFSKARERFGKRSLADAFFDAECRKLLDEEWAEFRAFCATGEGGGIKNDCSPNDGGTSTASKPARTDDSWKQQQGRVEIPEDSLRDSPPFSGAEKLSSVAIADSEELQDSMKTLGVGSLDDLAVLGGSTLRGSSVQFESTAENYILITSKVPVAADGSLSEGAFDTEVGLGQDESTGELVLGFESLIPKAGFNRKNSAAATARVTSLMQQAVLESMVRADDTGVARIDMMATGSDGSNLQGYRLWPQFGFDADLPREHKQRLASESPDLAKSIVRQIRPDLFATRVQPSPAIIKSTLESSSLTIQQLIASHEGDLWWNENGSTLPMSLSLKDKNSLGYRKFQKKAKTLKRLKGRNQGRAFYEWLEEEMEWRSGTCEKQQDGKFAKGNDCAAGDGGPSSSEGKKQNQGLSWSPGSSVSVITGAAISSPATQRSDDGKMIVSSSLGSRDDGTIYKFGGREYVSTVSVGAHLTEQQAAERGGRINTATKKLGEAERQYITESITTQTQAAISRGVRPAFYSPEETARQIEEYSRIIPEIKGGRLRDGTEITPENAEHVFRALQAMTSPNASPYANMQRTDAMLQKFFYGDGRLTTSTRFGVTGNSIIKSLSRYQAIVDRLGRTTDGRIDLGMGISRTRELFSNRVMRVGDFDDFFVDVMGDDDSMDWKPGNYLVDQEVPLFCVFGPKVGTFYANNNGELDHLTADIWWTRTWGRVTGELVVPASPSNGKKHATELSKVVSRASAEQLRGHDAQQLLDSLKSMQDTGNVTDVVRAWAGDRLRQYAAGDYKEKKGVAGRLNKLAKNIVENDVSLMGDPGAGSRRANMIAVAREAARKVGQPVAYMQDILWQDEQDAYAANGAKTVTGVGTLSLYSDQIAEIASDPDSRFPAAKRDKKDRRSIDPEQEAGFADDYERGGREQMLYDLAIDGLSDEEFADFVIALAEGSPKRESRAYCPTGDGGGRDNSCGSSDKGKEPIPAGDKSLVGYEKFTPSGNTKNSDFAKPPTDDEAKAALHSNKREKFGAHRELPAGYPLDLRIDIPAFEDHGAYVVTAHEHVNGVGVGAPVGYDSVIRLKGDVDFVVGETAATKVGRGKTNKNTHSTVKGKFDPSREIPSDIDAWTPVGYNPKTATYYYDKRTGKEVVGGVDSISVGNTVFVRVPKYGNGKDSSESPRNAKKNYRSADCGRDESGKFGPKNDCASDGGTATATEPKPTTTAFGSHSDSLGKVNWQTGESDPPFAGADKFSAVGISAPKKVGESLDSMKITPSQALEIAGAYAGGETTYIRPAPEFAREQPFAGSGVTPVFIDFDREVAGVQNGINGSAAIGIQKSTGKLAVYYSSLTVSPAVRNDASKRHTAAREFYRSMVAGVQAAREAGAGIVTLSAAGEKGDYYKGYTIWPRMGFDAPIPKDIARSLPENLSHAKTLLDLHATREGTKWWADNGVDVDVTLDLTNRSSEQNQIFDRFVKHFGKDRREMPLGSGDDWLSPEDLLRLDEMWNEVWDDGILDDYDGEEHARKMESRSADCGRVEGGKFGPKNDCASEDGPQSSLQVAGRKNSVLTKESFSSAVSKDGPSSEDPHESLKLLQTARKFEAIGSFRKNIDPQSPVESARFTKTFLSQLGSKNKSLPSEFVSDVSSRVGSSLSTSRMPDKAADRSACLLASISAAVTEHPSVCDAPLVAQTASEIYFRVLDDGEGPRRADEVARGAAAMYSILDDNITINTDMADSFIAAVADNEIAETKFFSSSHPGHALIHEHGHLLHYRALRKSAGLPESGRISAEQAKKLFEQNRQRESAVVEYFKSGEDGAVAMLKTQSLSRYGASSPDEFVAEYFAGLATRSVPRDSHLDKVMGMLGFPADKLPSGKKMRGKR